MRILQDKRDLGQRDLAEILAMRIGELNYRLSTLIDKGLVKMGKSQKSKNKLKYVYLLTPLGIAENVLLISRFPKCKVREYGALRLEIEVSKAEVSDASGRCDREKAVVH